MVTICSRLERKAKYLSKLPICIGNHTNTLKRAALKLGCGLDKVADNGEVVTNHMMYNSYATAQATYELRFMGNKVYFVVNYRVYKY